MKRTHSKLPSAIPADLAYRGYLIRAASLDGSAFVVMKDGFCICHARTQEHAKRLIDELID